MMGLLPAGQSALFYDFRLDDHVPDDHSLRQIDRILDLTKLRKHLAPSYSHTARPSIDPELMIRMLLIGYCLAYTFRETIMRRSASNPLCPFGKKANGVMAPSLVATSSLTPSRITTPVRAANILNAIIERSKSSGRELRKTTPLVIEQNRLTVQPAH